MTVHVQESIKGIHLQDERNGDHHHRPEKKKGRRPDLDTDRTWAFDCDKVLVLGGEEIRCEDAAVDRFEFAAKTAAGVPLTPDEAAKQDDDDRQSGRAITDAVKGLAEMAREQAATTKGSKAHARASA